MPKDTRSSRILKNLFQSNFFFQSAASLSFEIWRSFSYFMRKQPFPNDFRRRPGDFPEESILRRALFLGFSTRAGKSELFSMGRNFCRCSIDRTGRYPQIAAHA